MRYAWDAMPLVIRHLRRWAASTPRLVDAALCRAMAWRLAHHASRQQPVKVVTRLVIPTIPGEDSDAMLRRVLDEMRRDGFGTWR